MNSDELPQATEKTVVMGEEVYACPSCGQAPQPEAVGAGVEASCEDDDCLVQIWRWWEDD